MHKRRLDFVTEKRELINDILTLGGDGDLESLHDEIGSFGESLEEALHSMSLPHLRVVHAKIVTGDLPVEITDEVF
jgi:hypothetical protein